MNVKKMRKAKWPAKLSFPKDGLRDFIDLPGRNTARNLYRAIAMEGERGGMPIE